MVLGVKFSTFLLAIFTLGLRKEALRKQCIPRLACEVSVFMLGYTEKSEFFHLFFLDYLHKSTGSYCCHFCDGMGITLLSFTSNFFMCWARHYQMSYPVHRQVLLERGTTSMTS